MTLPQSQQLLGHNKCAEDLSGFLSNPSDDDDAFPLTFLAAAGVPFFPFVSFCTLLTLTMFAVYRYVLRNISKAMNDIRYSAGKL